MPKLFWFFFKTGLLVFGSGLVVVPFLKAYVVDQYHWISNQAFVDAVAVGIVSPGPVVITATFVGYLTGSLAGAFAATVGIFTPSLIFVLLGTPLLTALSQQRTAAGLRARHHGSGRRRIARDVVLGGSQHDPRSSSVWSC